MYDEYEFLKKAIKTENDPLCQMLLKNPKQEQYTPVSSEMIKNIKNHYIKVNKTCFCNY